MVRIFPSKQVTLRDVADKAGVSQMTVSKVMRGAGNISAETRRRIKQAADDLGYVPNSLAGSLSSRTSKIVAVIIPSVSDIVFSEVLSGINAILRPQGLHTFIGESHFDAEIEAEQIRTMLSFRPAGLLLNAGTMRSTVSERLLENRPCPAIQLWDCDSGGLDFSAGPSHDQAGRLVAEHCLAHGFRRIAYVGAELGKDLCAARRQLALRAALADKGVELISITSDDRPRQAATGRALMQNLLQDHPRIEVVHFLNDAMALGGLAYLHEVGIAVPDRISVIGFNGTSIPNTVRTRLTTLDVPRQEIGEIAAQALLDINAGLPIAASWEAGLRLVPGNTTPA